MRGSLLIKDKKTLPPMCVIPVAGVISAGKQKSHKALFNLNNTNKYSPPASAQDHTF